MQPRSIRLNQDLRDEFVRTVIEEIMPDKNEPTIQKFQERYAQAVYDATYGEIADTMSQLPDWAVKETTCIFAKLEGATNEIGFIFQTPVKAFYKNNYTDYSRYMSHDSSSPLPVLASDHPVTQAYIAQNQAQTDWGVKRRQLEAQLSELTSTCNTSGQLFKTWPKAMEFAHIFPQPEVKERTEWKPAMDADELDLGIELSQVEVTAIQEN